MSLLSAVSTRNDPDMPRWQISTGPSSICIVRYLARLPSAVTVLPASRSEKRSGKGKRRSGLRASTLTSRAPSSTGCTPRRTVSTSGSSGMAAYRCKERGAVTAGREAEVIRDGFADIGQGRSEPDVAALQPGSDADHRNAFACMVGAAPGRIIAVVGGEDEQVARLDAGQRFRQPAVEGLERRGIAGDIAPMAELGVEIDEIGKDQIAFARVVHGTQRLVEHRRVATSLADLRNAAMSEDVADLADGDDLAAALRQPVEQGRFRRRNRIVAAVVGAQEGGSCLAHERPRDHPPDLERIDQPAHRQAKLVKSLQAEMRLVRGDLQYRVYRGVTDRLAGADVLLAEALDDPGSGRMAIAEDARHLAFMDDRGGQPGREGRHGVGKVAPVETPRQAGNLPVPRWRVLAARDLLGRTVE